MKAASHKLTLSVSGPDLSNMARHFAKKFLPSWSIKQPQQDKITEKKKDTSVTVDATTVMDDDVQAGIKGQDLKTASTVEEETPASSSTITTTITRVVVKKEEGGGQKDENDERRKETPSRPQLPRTENNDSSGKRSTRRYAKTYPAAWTLPKQGLSSVLPSSIQIEPVVACLTNILSSRQIKIVLETYHQPRPITQALCPLLPGLRLAPSPGLIGMPTCHLPHLHRA